MIQSVVRSVYSPSIRRLSYSAIFGPTAPVREKLLLTLRPTIFGDDVILDDIYGNLGEDVVISWRERSGEDVPILGYMIPESMQTEMFAILGVGLWFDSNGVAKQVNNIELSMSPEINQWETWYRVDAGAGLGKNEVLIYDPTQLLEADVTKIAAWFKEPGATSYPSAFFNGMDFRLATYTGGPTYTADNRGVLLSPGANLPAEQGMRLATTLADGAVLGPELITNQADREFSSDTGYWGVGANNWSIAGGVATHTPGAISSLYSGAYSAGTYTVSIEIKRIIAGSVSIKIGSGSISPTYTTVGVYTYTATMSGDTIIRVATPSSDFNGDIDNVSIKEVIPTYVTTDESGNQILPSTPQKTVTYSTDWLSRTFAETFDKFDISDPLKAPGWLCEPVRTNKVTCRKSNPVDFNGVAKTGGDANTVWSVSSDTTALTSAGLIAICNSGKVYEVDNTLGAVAAEVQIANNSSSVSAHSSFIFLRGGPGSYRDVSVAWSPFAYTDQYTLLKFENKTPGYAGIKERINIPAGSSVRFILPQLEEGSFATSPICKASDGSDPLTSLTRAATIPSFPTAGKIPVNDFAIRMIVVPRASGQSGAYLFGSYVDSSNYTSLYVQPGSIILRKRVSSVNTDATVTLTNSIGVPIDLVLVSTAAGGMQISARTFSSTWGSFTNGTVNSSSAAKANAQIGSTYQLGALNSIKQFTGNISLFDCVPIPTGITDPMAWAKTHWADVPQPKTLTFGTSTITFNNQPVVWL